MQENKFENRVQQQMEGFRIPPSEAVWGKVEEELRKKKKRRVVFIFLLAGLSLLGYSGYFIFNNSKPSLVQQDSSLPNNKEQVTNESLPGIENSTINKQQDRKENQLPFEKEKNIKPESKGNSAKTNDIVLNDEETASEENFLIKKQERRAVKKITNKFPSVTTVDEDNINENVSVTSNSLQAIQKLSRQHDPAIPATSKANISQPGFIKHLEEGKQLPVPGKNIQVKKDSIVRDIAANKEEPADATKKKKQMPKINWGIELSGGISANRENAFSFNGADGSQKSFAADLLPSPTNCISGGGNPAIVYLPPSIQAGPAFKAGVVAEMKISKKSSFSSGLRYAYFSNNIKVGTYTAVAFSNSYSQSVRADAIYRGGQQKEYTNQFHFIQLPLQYQLQLNKGVKLPILWNIGASAGYLISTSSLVYDTAASGIYFQDKAAFNKFHLNLNTGFSFRFGNKNKIQWSLGPELSLGMNKLTKDDYTRKQYLLYGGITGRIIFAKKK
jgi:hypothetical protein